MTKVEEPESNDNDASIKSNTSKESDNIKIKQKKNHNKKKISHSDDAISEKVKKASISFWKEPCREILETLKKDKRSAFFRAPAVKSFISQRDKEYYKIQIKEPRDLGTITKKINGDNYSPKEFYNDIELCWSNAKKFNDDDTEVYKDAIYLKNLSDKLFKEKNIEEIIEKYNTEKDNFNVMSEDKENMNDNTNNSNNNTNDSNNTGDKLNLNESGILENGTKEKNSENSDDKDTGQKKEKERKKSIDSNSSNRSNKDEESYNESGHRKHHHHHKMTGKKRRRHKHRDKDRDKDKDKDKEKSKEENKDEDKKEKKRGRKRKKIDNDDIIKISKKKINFDDLKKKYPINYPVIASPEEIELMAKKSGKNKIKKMIKLNNTGKNHDNHHKSENHKKRMKNMANLINNLNIVNIPNNGKKVTYKFDWEFLENSRGHEVENIFIENDIERRKKENEQMADFDINCNSESVQVTHKHKSSNNHNNIHNNINGIKDAENIQKKKKNDTNKNKNNNNTINITNNNTNYDNTDLNYITINNNDIEVEVNNSINNNNPEVIQKSNNVSNDNSINEIKMVPEINTAAVKIVEKGYEKNVELRIELTRYFDTLTDSNMVDLLVYIENIRPQSISLLENDTIYIDMDAFNEETFNKVFDYIKNIE